MIEVQTRQLRHALEIVDRVREKRAAIPVLQTVRASANGKFRIEASDLDTTALVEIPYSGGEDEAGVCLPETHRLRAALGQVGGEVTRIGFGAKAKTVIESGALSVEIKGLPGDDFPGVYTVDEEQFSADVGTDVLAQLARAMPAISTEETRYYLNGLNVRKVGEWLWQFTATDGHRVHMIDVPLPGAVGEMPKDTIIPRQFLNHVLALFARSKEPVRIAYGLMRPRNSDGTLTDGGGAARLCVSGTVNGLLVRMATKLIDGSYPDYSRVIPSQVPHGLLADRKALVSAVQAVAGFCESKVRPVKLVAQPGGLRISVANPIGLAAAITVAAEHDLPPDFHIGFNGTYLLDMLGQLRGEQVQLGLTNPGAPTTLRDPADTAFSAVLMPMRV